MAFLVPCVLLSGVIMTVFKISAKNGWNGSKIIMVNYCTAVTISLFNLTKNGQLRLPGKMLAGADAGTLFAQKTVPNPIVLILLFGCVQGLVFVSEFIVRQASIAQNGAVLTTFFLKSAFVGNILISALLWRERPSSLQWSGIALIIVALILTTGNLKMLNVHRPILFLLLMMIGIFVESISKAVTVYIPSEQYSLYMGVVFFVALVFCIGKNAWAAQKSGETFLPSLPEFLFGGLLGVVNMLSAWLHLKSLNALPTSIVFPTQAAGDLLLAFILGRALFHEPSSKKLHVALGIAMVSLIIINI